MYAKDESQAWRFEITLDTTQLRALVLMSISVHTTLQPNLDWQPSKASRLKPIRNAKKNRIHVIRYLYLSRCLL